MAPGSRMSKLREWAVSQRTLTIVTAIAIAIPTAYLFHATVGVEAGDFLLLWTLGVGVPQTYDAYWPTYDQTWKAIAWVVGGCGVATGLFVSLYLFSNRFLDLSPFLASIGAFLITYLGPMLWLGYRGRQ